MQLKKERKGKERKGKGLLYLIAIAVLISIVFIACKNKPTGMNDFETDIIDISDDIANKEPPAPTTDAGDNNTTQELTQDDIDKLGSKITSSDFMGYYFESADGTFKAQVLRMSDGTPTGMFNALKLKGTDASGSAVNRVYEIGSARNANDKTATYRVFECPIFPSRQTRTEATFRNGGTLELKLQNSSGTSYTLKLALKKKAKTDTTDLIK